VALARARAGGTSELLLQALNENAHRDVLRVAAFQGFALIGSPSAVPAILDYLQSDRTTRFAREAAVSALGELDGADPKVRQALEQARASDFWPAVRQAAGHALTRLNSPPAPHQ
jgi:HEAT repeat protein